MRSADRNSQFTIIKETPIIPLWGGVARRAGVVKERGVYTMKKPIKFIIIGLVILVCAVGGYYYMTMPVPVRMTEIKAGIAELTFMEQGIVTAENTVMVYGLMQGEIEGFYVREGQEVKAGDIILKVDDVTLRMQLDQVRSGIKSLESQLAGVDVEDEARRLSLITSRNSLEGELISINAQANQSNQANVSSREVIDEQLRVQQLLIDQYQNETDRAGENFERYNDLYQNGVVALVDLEAAESALKAAETQLEAAKGQMAIIAAGIPSENSADYYNGMRASINAQIAGIDRQLEQDTTETTKAYYESMIAVERIKMTQLEMDIENTSILAPVSGIVTKLQAKSTNIITAAAPVAEIAVSEKMSIDVYVSTQDIGSINIGDEVVLTLRQRVGDVDFSGVVAEIETTAEVRLSALGVEERKVRVRVEPIDIPPDAGIGFGHAFDVTFCLFREENRILVPRTAVFKVNGQDTVWGVRGGSSGGVEAIPVETGMELRTLIIIETGLNQGDYVVNDANNSGLKAGVKVINEE